MGIEVEKRDISVAGRLLSHFPERLAPEQRIKDELAGGGLESSSLFTLALNQNFQSICPLGRVFL